MKDTLLDMVQEIMSDLDTDEVNSIFDTVESEQVAAILRRAYFNLMSNRNWPHLSKLIQFSPITDYTRPTHLRMPSGIKELQVLKYDVRSGDETRRKYKDIDYKDPIEFLNYTNQRDSDEENVLLVNNGGGVELLITNDKKPKYWTSFNDIDIVFDSFDNTVSTVMENSKIQAQAYMQPTWEMDDDFVPDLPIEAFANLIEEAKSTAFLVLKKEANQKAEANAQRQARWLSRKSWSAKGGIKFAKFGRRGRYGIKKDPTFTQD